MVYSVVIATLVSYLLGNLNGAVCISALMPDKSEKSIEYPTSSVAFPRSIVL